MFEINFYADNSGNEPVREYLETLVAKKDKDSRIKLNKIRDYIKILSLHGTRAGQPYTKHIEGDLWELRPLRDRILFFAWDDNRFILLHCFMKQTQKTPAKEIDIAKRRMKDFIERSKQHE